MAKVIEFEVAKRIDQEMSESQYRDLEMYRKLGVLSAVKIEGRDAEACELKWLNAITDKDSDTVYACDAKQ